MTLRLTIHKLVDLSNTFCNAACMLDDPKSPSDQPNRRLTSFVTFRLARTQNKLNAQASVLLKHGSGLSLVEWRIIQLLRLSEGASMSALASDVQMDKGQLSRKIAAMIDKGLVTATPNAEDHRKQDLHLTAHALAISDKMMPIMQRRQDRLVAGISQKDLDVFFKVLGSIEDAAGARNI